MKRRAWLLSKGELQPLISTQRPGYKVETFDLFHIYIVNRETGCET